MSKKLSAVGLITIALCFYCAFSFVPSRAAEENRTVNIKIEDYPNAFQNKEPVKIIGLYHGTTLLRSGEDFQADKDWLRDLRFMVKNVSDQSIRSIILSLDLAEDNLPVGDPARRVRRIDIHYGRGYLYTREPDTRVPDALLKPGEVASFGYNLKNDHHHSLPNKGVIFLGAVVFEDIDKGWYAPTYAVRCGRSWCADPDKPYRVGQVRKGATMLKASFVSKQPQDQDKPQDLTVQERYMTEPPLAILNARRTDEGLTVEVQNRGLAPVEYFELHMAGTRVFAGRNSIDVRHLNHPKNLEQEPLSLAPCIFARNVNTDSQPT